MYYCIKYYCETGLLGLPGCDEALSGMAGASLTNEVPGIM